MEGHPQVPLGTPVSDQGWCFLNESHRDGSRGWDSLCSCYLGDGIGFLGYPRDFLVKAWDRFSFYSTNTVADTRWQSKCLFSLDPTYRMRGVESWILGGLRAVF